MTWVGAGVAAVEVGTSLYEGSQNEKAQNRATKANAWRGAAGQDLVKRTQEIADRPYVPYEGERVAGESGNETKAYDMAGQTGMDSPEGKYFDKAGKQVDFVAGNGWNADTAKKYMDPYIGQVVDQSLRKEQDTYATQENQRRGSAAQVGAFGGDRDAILQSQAEKSHNQNISDITTAGYSDAFNNATRTWQADNARALDAAKGYESVGGDITRMNSDQITNLLKTGGSRRLLEQAQLDVNFSNYVEKRDWSVSNIKPLMDAVGAANGSPAQQATESHKLGQTMGALATVAGYFGQQRENQVQSDQSDVNSGMDQLNHNIGSDPNYFGNTPVTEIGGGANGNNAAEGY